MDYKEFFKIKHPILAAPMNQVSDVKLAVACSKAGILPSLSAYTWAENYYIDYLALENVVKDFQDQAGTDNILVSAGVGDLLSYDFFNFSLQSCFCLSSIRYSASTKFIVTARSRPAASARSAAHPARPGTS
jgi:hypothetical protein